MDCSLTEPMVVTVASANCWTVTGEREVDISVNTNHILASSTKLPPAFPFRDRYPNLCGFTLRKREHGYFKLDVLIQAADVGQ